MSIHATIHFVLFGYEYTLVIGLKKGNRHPGR